MKRYFNQRTFGGWAGVVLSLYMFYFYTDTGVEVFLFIGAILLVLAMIWILAGRSPHKG